MQYTPNYNLITVEGTDVVNPLTQMNPNFTDIDAAMFANKKAVIGTASEIVTGTVHAITRSNTDSDYFRFTATGNWTTGDSMSVDGTTVSVYLSDGTTPETGAYIINTEVLALLSGTRVTLITSAGVEVAKDVSYNNASSGLASTNVQDAINELALGTVIATAAAGQTLAAQMATIWVAYQGLTYEQKLRSILLQNPVNIFRNYRTDLGYFTQILTYPNEIYISSMRLDNQSYYAGSAVGDAVSNQSNVISNDTLTLLVI